MESSSLVKEWPVVWQGITCIEIQRGHYMKLWKWSLDCVRDAQDVDDPEPWDVSRGKLQTGGGTGPKREVTCIQEVEGAVGLKSHLSILISEETDFLKCWNCERLWGLLSWTKCILCFDMAMRLRGPGNGMWRFEEEWPPWVWVFEHLTTNWWYCLGWCSFARESLSFVVSFEVV